MPFKKTVNNKSYLLYGFEAKAGIFFGDYVFKLFPL